MTDQSSIETEAAAAHAGILPAIAAAMSDVRAIGKADRNKHDGYDFASIDKFLALANPICARHGLIVISDEAAREDFTRKGKNGESPWMRLSFTFTIHHVSGQSLPTVTRTAEVLRNGAQAYGSAQSYCLKHFLRGLLLIPTGDKDDADFRAKDNALPEFDPHAAVGRIVSSLSNAKTLDDLADRWKREQATLADIKRADPAAYDSAARAKDERKVALSTPKNADLGGDEIPF